jgi:hypothetical protein
VKHRGSSNRHRWAEQQGQRHHCGALSSPTTSLTPYQQVDPDAASDVRSRRSCFSLDRGNRPLAHSLGLTKLGSRTVCQNNLVGRMETITAAMLEKLQVGVDNEIGSVIRRAAGVNEQARRFARYSESRRASSRSDRPDTLIGNHRGFLKSGTFFALLFFGIAPGFGVLLLWRGVTRALRETHHRKRIALATLAALGLWVVASDFMLDEIFDTAWGLMHTRPFPGGFFPEGWPISGLYMDS